MVSILVHMKRLEIYGMFNSLQSAEELAICSFKFQ